MTISPPSSSGGVAVLGIVLYAGAVFLRGAMLMLLFLALNSWVSAAVPLVGYWHCVVIGMLLGTLFNPRLSLDKD